MRDWLKTEDWWALWIGLALSALALAAAAGADLLGWGVATSVWMDVGKAIGRAQPGSMSSTAPVRKLKCGSVRMGMVRPTTRPPRVSATSEASRRCRQAGNVPARGFRTFQFRGR